MTVCGGVLIKECVGVYILNVGLPLVHNDGNEAQRSCNGPLCYVTMHNTCNLVMEWLLGEITLNEENE